MKPKGFTLIELLLVIAIVSLLSSIFFYNTTEAKKKAEDAHMKAESAQVARAIELYRIDNDGRVPTNSAVKGQMVREGDTSWTDSEGRGGYENAMQQLVAGGYLNSVPTSPSGGSYAYMTADEDEPTDAIFGADLNTDADICIGNGSRTFITSSCETFRSGSGDGGDETPPEELSEGESFRAGVNQLISGIESYKSANGGEIPNFGTFFSYLHIRSDGSTLSYNFPEATIESYAGEFPYPPFSGNTVSVYFYSNAINCTQDGTSNTTKKSVIIYGTESREYFDDWTWHYNNMNGANPCYPLD